MKSDLKNLASQQEIYYSDYYTYTSNTTQLGFVDSEGVTVTIGGISLQPSRSVELVDGR